MREWLFILQLQISIAVVVVLLLRQAMKKMPKVYSYLLWLLVFARLLVPISIESGFSFMPSEQEQNALVEQVLESVTGMEDGVISGVDVQGNSGYSSTGTEGNPEWAQEEAASDYQPITGETAGGQSGVGEMWTDQPGNMDITDSLLGEGALGGTVGTADSVDAADVVEDIDGLGNDFSAWPLVVLWILGAAAVLGYNGVALRKVHRKLKSARYLLDRIEIGAGSAPVYECEGIHTPFTLGFFTPTIYLPTGLTEDEQEYILCHERVHVGRKDNLVKNLAFLLTAVYWFNPFVWVAFFFMERDMEMSCDEKVLKIMGKNIKRNYSQSLLDFAARPEKMPATHLTFGENSVKQRVKNVLSYKNAKKWSVAIGAVVLVIVVVALFTTGRDESEQVDGQGSLVQGEESRGDDTASGGESPDGAGDGSGAGQGINNSGEGNQNADGGDSGGESSQGSTGGNFYGDVQDPIYVSKTHQLALDGWRNRFAAQNEKITYSEFDYDDNTGKAVIRYVVADGWERYLLLEVVKVVESNDLYYVEQESLTEYRNIETNEEFETLYGAPGLRDLNLLEYNASYYRSILQQFHTGGADAEYCARFLDPVTAAVEMLNLGEGSGVARLKDGSFISDGGTLGGVVLDSIVSGGTTNGTPNRTTNGLNLQDAYFQEGTYAYVTYTFAKDGSRVEIPMRLIEGSYGLWSVDANAVREVYATEEFLYYYDRDPGYDLEFTEYGIYRNAGGVLTNIYPYYVQPDLAWDEEDGILYFAVDSSYQEGTGGYTEDVVCMMKLSTGEIDIETFSLENMPLKAAGYIRGVNAGAGYLIVTRGNTVWDSIHYSMPLVNTGDTALATGYTYKGKAVKDLTAEELDAYSLELRNVILKKGEVVKLSNRTMDETYAYVDLDGDGKAEKIVLSADTSSEEYQYVSRKYDCFRLQVDDSIVTGQKELLENELWFFSFDGENIVIALYGDGPSDDYTTQLYMYKDGELRNIGTVECRIDDLTLDPAKGILHVEDAYHNFMQPVWIRRDWVLNEDGQVEEIPQDTYEIVMGRTILPDLLVPLPVHETPGSEEVTYIQPQKVNFLRFNSTFDWVYIWAADGSSGWFEIDVEQDSGVTVKIKDLNLNHGEVFTLYYAG